jgi:hypothetical protein
MSPDEKKASVTELLQYFEEVIHQGIDSGAGVNYNSLELILMTVQIAYQRALADYLLSTTQTANTADPANAPQQAVAAAPSPEASKPMSPAPPLPDESKGAKIIPFPTIKPKEVPHALLDK